MPSFEPRVEGLGVVFLGSFNPGIFHPAWIQSVGLFSELEARNASVLVLSPEVGQIRLDEITLTIVPEKLQITASDILVSDQVRDLATGFLKVLPHSPVKAVGINRHAHLSVGDEEQWHSIGHMLAPKDSVWSHLFHKRTPGMMSLTIEALAEGSKDQTIFTTVEPSRKVQPGLFLKTNHHLDVSSAAGELETAVVAADYVESCWDEALATIESVAERIFTAVHEQSS